MAPAGGNPGFTDQPTDANSVPVDLSPYTIGYAVDMPRVPMRSELAELTQVTREHLEEFFFDYYDGDDMTFLDDFITNLDSSSYVMGRPIDVTYSSTARFSPFTRVYPSQGQLDQLLEQAFEGVNLIKYQSRLEDLSSGNVFKGSSASLGDEPVVRVSKKSNGAAIAAGAVAFTLFAAAVVIYKRRSEDEEFMGKDLNNKPSDITVAGETFAGETYDGTASVGAATADYSYRQRDEEEGLRASNLGTIQENADDASLNPAWATSQMQDVVDDEEEEEDSASDDSAEHFDSAAPGSAAVFNHLAREQGSFDQDGDRAIRMSVTEVSLASVYTNPKNGIEGQSFEEVALQEPSSEIREDDSEEQPASEISQSLPQQEINESEDHEDGYSDEDEESVSRRPRTVAEIEAMLSADMEDDDTEADDAGSHNSTLESGSLFVPNERPRTVSEIESLLSAGLEDDDLTYSTGRSSEM